MKIEIKKDGLKRELLFEIPKERVSKKLDEVYVELGKSANIKGYRPGKAPRSVIESHHGKLAQDETIKKLIPEAYEEGIARENISPIELLEIHDVSFKDGVLKFTAKFDTKPEVSVKNYKGIKVKRGISEVTDDEVNKTIEYFKKGQGDDKNLTIDDAFAKGLGYPNLADLKKSIMRQLEMDKDRQNRMEVENQIVDELLKQSKLTVPESLIKKQEKHRLEEMKKRFQSQGMTEEDINKKSDEVKGELHAAVERDVKIYFILEKIAELENISVNEGENLPQKVIEFLFKEASWEGESRIIT